MIFSSVGLFLISNTLLCVATATRSPSQVSELVISSLDTRPGKGGQKEVQVSAAGSSTLPRADDIEEPALTTDVIDDPEPDLSGADASEATQATLAPSVSQIVVSVLVEQRLFYVKESSEQISFERGEADSLYITYYETWQMVPGDPAHFGHIYQQKEWKLFNVESAVKFFVAPENRRFQMGGQNKPFLFAGWHDKRHPCLVFGYVDVETHELKIVKLLYLAPARPFARIFKFCDVFVDSTFEVMWGKKRWEVFRLGEPQSLYTEPDIICPCGYTLTTEMRF